VFLLAGNSLLKAQRIIAYYPFDNSTTDASGNGNNGMISGTVKMGMDRFGNPCGALSFNGVDGYISVPSSKTIKSPKDEFSVTVWYKIEQSPITPSIKWLTLVCKGDVATETLKNPQYRVQVMQSPSQSTISINTDFTEYDADYNKHPFQYGEWHFYAMVYDGNAVKVYLDNVLQWSFAYSKPLEENDAPLYIGKDVPGSTEFFCGSLDELKIFNDDLSENQLTALYNDTRGSNFDGEFSLQLKDDIQVNTDKNECYATVNYSDPILKTGCTQVNLTRFKGLPSGSKFLPGIHNVSYKAESSLTGQSQIVNFRIFVKNTSKPALICQTDTNLVAKNKEGIAYKYKTPIVKSCGKVNVTLIAGINSGDVFPIGVTKLKFKATDEFGNIAECDYNVTVTKTEEIAQITPKPKEIPKPDPIKVEPPKKTEPAPPINKPNPVKIPDPEPELEEIDTRPPPKPKGEPKKIPPQEKPKPQEVPKKEDSYKDPISGTLVITKFKELFDNCELTLAIYDDAKEDGDIVSIYFNDELIVDHETLQNRSHRVIFRNLKLKQDQDNFFISKAWNLGSSPPNTMNIEIYSGTVSEEDILKRKKKTVKIISLDSKIGVSGAIKLNCK